MARRERPQIPIGSDHVAQLDRNAHVALARRSGSYFVERILGLSGMVLVAILSLLGLWIGGTSPLTMAMLLLASAWLGICADLVKALTLRDAVSREIETRNADHLVWAIANALMTGRTTIRSPDATAGQAIRHLLTADLICACAVTGIALLMLRDGGHDIATLLARDTWVPITFAAMVAVQAGMLAWMVLQHRSGRGELAPPRAALGLRGVAMIPVLAVIVIASSDGRDLRLALTMVNGLTLAIVAPLMVLSVAMERREVLWLRERVANGQRKGCTGVDGDWHRAKRERGRN